MNFEVDLWQFLVLILGGPIAYTMRQNYRLAKESEEWRKLWAKESKEQKEAMDAALASVRSHVDDKLLKAQQEFWAALEKMANSVSANHQKLGDAIHTNELKAHSTFASNKYLQDVEARLQACIGGVKASVDRIEEHMMRKG